MGTGPAKVVRFVDDRAEFELSRELVERCGFLPGEELLTFAAGDDVLLLAREATKSGFFVGELGTLSVAEIFGFVCSAIRSGTLVVQSALARRRIVFYDGQVIFAASTEPAEQLGNVLFRSGALTLPQLEESEPKVSATLKLGRLLVDAGHLDPAQLYKGVQQQVREIVMNSFGESEGEFAFIEGESTELNTVKLSDRTRDLVLAGMARNEELGVLRQTVDPAGRPRRVEGSQAPLGRDSRVVYEAIDGVKTARELARSTRLGEYACYKVLVELSKESRAHVTSPARKAERSAPLAKPAALAGSPPQRYKAAVARISEELKTAGQVNRLASFFSCLSREQDELFQGVRFEEGQLDLDAVLANAQRVHKGAMGRAMALEALDAFVSFALFEARNLLPARRALALSREVAGLLRGR